MASGCRVSPVCGQRSRSTKRVDRWIGGRGRVAQSYGVNGTGRDWESSRGRGRHCRQAASQRKKKGAAPSAKAGSFRGFAEPIQFGKLIIGSARERRRGVVEGKENRVVMEHQHPLFVVKRQSKKTKE